MKIADRALNTLRGSGDSILALFLRKYRALVTGASRSLCSRERLRALQKIAELVSGKAVPGDVVECGVYLGGSAAVIAERLLNGPLSRELWLFDVFSGMPEPGPEDPPEAWKHAGQYVSSEVEVRQTLSRVGIAGDKVHVVAGNYSQTLPSFKSPAVAFLHVDCDWYASVELCLETFYDHVVPGGAVVLDDYGHWSGCRKATDAFLVKRSLAVTLTPLEYTSHYFFKPMSIRIPS